MLWSKVGTTLVMLCILSIPQTSRGVYELVGLDEFEVANPVPCPGVTLNEVHNAGGTHRYYFFSGSCTLFSNYPPFQVSATAVSKSDKATEKIEVSSPLGAGKIHTSVTGCNIDPFVAAFIEGTSCTGPRNIAFSGELFDDPGTPIVVPIAMGLYFAGSVKDWYDCADWSSSSVSCVESSGAGPPPPPSILAIVKPSEDYAAIPAPDEAGYFYDMEVKWVGETPPKRLHAEFERMEDIKLADLNDPTSVSTTKVWQKKAGPLNHTPWKNLEPVPAKSGQSSHTVAVPLNTGQQGAVFTPGLYRVRVIPEDPDGPGKVRYFWVGEPAVDSEVLHHLNLPGQRKTLINKDVTEEQFDDIKAAGEAYLPSEIPKPETGGDEQQSIDPSKIKSVPKLRGN